MLDEAVPSWTRNIAAASWTTIRLVHRTDRTHLSVGFTLGIKPRGTRLVFSVEQIRDEFTTLDGLVIEAGFDSLLDPTELVVRLDDGIGDADSCRFDIRWYQTGYYNFHHTDEQDVNFRFDYHPKPDAPKKHFHNPPGAPSEHPQHSCIT